MQHSMTDRDQSAYADSIKRLTIEMRETLGMGPAADIVAENEAPPAERNPLVLGRLQFRHARRWYGV